MIRRFFLIWIGIMVVLPLVKAAENRTVSVTPLPAKMEVKAGSFRLTPQTVLVVRDVALKEVAGYFAYKMRRSTGYDFPMDASASERGIVLTIDDRLPLGEEGYSLEVTPERIRVAGKSGKGVFYGMQTVMQLLPPEIESDRLVENAVWELPCVEIEDEPRFAYRGMMLDACRHFLDVDFVKKQLDVMALFKMNRFHWHLTDDHLWTIEIKKYPRLTEVGSVRYNVDGSVNCGFYTQEQIKEVVAYAAERKITVVPEIELPGHALAAITAYPELSCIEGPFQLRNQWGVEDNVFCAGNDRVFCFLEDVLEEVIPLFPGHFFHIGGDECPKVHWKACRKCQRRMQEENLKDEHELQSYFVHRIERILLKHGKAMIGWDEILEGGLAASATVMSWTGEEGGITAANMGHDVIMTPLKYAYYDAGQGAPEVEPITISFGISLEKAYGYEPVARGISADKAHHVLGAQANMWTEYSPVSTHTEYMLYPRLLAMAELTWTKKEDKDYASFVQRLDNQQRRLDAHHINYHVPLPEGPRADEVAFLDKAVLTFHNSRDLPMVYTVDGSQPTAQSDLYTDPLLFTKNTTLRIATLLPSGKLSRIRIIDIRKEKKRPAIKRELAEGVELLRAPGKFYYVTDLIDAVWEKPLVVPGFHLDVQPEAGGAFLYRGYFKVPADGVYYFSTEMDQLKIDGEKIISNSGKMIRHSVSRTSIALQKGIHSFELIYINSNIGGFHRYWNNRGFRLVNEDGTLTVPEVYH